MKPATAMGTPYALIPKTYAGLMARHMIRPIRDEVDAENAAEMIALLAGHALNEEQSDYLDLLSDLYEKWEIEQCPIEPAYGAELLRLVLAQRNEDAGSLAALLEIEPSLADRLVRGEDELTAPQIRIVANAYSLDPAALLGVSGISFQPRSPIETAAGTSAA
jgi:antitoxin component HigA of HigAB toxin-antitoxin module